MVRAVAHVAQLGEQQVAFGRRALLEHVEQRQRDFALAHVAAGGLAGHFHRRIIQYVVFDLEGDAQVVAELAHPVYVLFVRTDRDRPGGSAGAEQRGGFLIDDVVVDFARHRQFLGLLGLDQLSLAHLVDRTRDLGQHVPALVLQADVIGARENVVADQNGRPGVPQRVDGRLAASDVSLVDDVVMDQRGRMDHLDQRRAHVAPLADLAVQGGRQQHEQRAELLAPVAEDVVADRADIGVVAMQDRRDVPLVAAYPVGYGGLDLFQRDLRCVFHDMQISEIFLKRPTLPRFLRGFRRAGGDRKFRGFAGPEATRCRPSGSRCRLDNRIAMRIVLMVNVLCAATCRSEASRTPFRN